MTDFNRFDLKKIYEERRAKVTDYLNRNELGAAVFIDSEAHREPALRYLCGHTSDAVLILFESGNSILIPWDEILARKNGFADKMIPYTKYGNNSIQAVQANLNAAAGIKNRKVEVPPSTSYPDFLHFIDALPGWDVKCREDGVHNYTVQLRMIKDEYEIACTKEAARIGDLIIDKIEAGIRNGEIKTESDAALLIERECRINGCERTGFDTLATGPERSWAIHCFPNYTNAAWPADGLSILDFGVVFNGYTSDTTITVVKNANEQQEKQVQLVQAAYNECLLLYKKDIPVKNAEEKAQTIFATAKRRMPHTLGHAVGLEIHESPRVSSKMSEDVKFLPGMIVTLEPGLYDEKLGGCRLENDIFITENGNEVISHARIIRL